MPLQNCSIYKNEVHVGALSKQSIGWTIDKGKGGGNYRESDKRSEVTCPRNKSDGMTK